MILIGLPAGFHDDPFRTTRPCAIGPLAAAGRVGGAGTAIYKDAATFRSGKTEVFGPKFGQRQIHDRHAMPLVLTDPPLHRRLRPMLVARVDRLMEAFGEAPDLIAGRGSRPDRVDRQLAGRAVGRTRPGARLAAGHSGALKPALTAAQIDQGDATGTDFLADLRDLLARRRGRPGDPEMDVPPRLIEGSDLSEAEFLHDCIFILNAGHETTGNPIGNALWLRDRQSARRFGSVVQILEGTLRLEPANPFGSRKTLRPVTLHRADMPARTDLHLCLGASNRDLAVVDVQDMMRHDRGMPLRRGRSRRRRFCGAFGTIVSPDGDRAIACGFGGERLDAALA